MSKNKTEIRTYAEWIRKYSKRLFSTAYVITGDYASAERALNEALFRLSAYGKAYSERTFSAAAYETVRDAAFGEIPEDGTRLYDWRGFEDDPDQYPDAGYECIVNMDADDKRLILMHYGMRLKNSETAYALGSKNSDIKARLRAVTQSVADAAGRKLSDTEDILAEVAEYELANPAAAAPDAGSLIRTLEMDLSHVPPRRHPIRKTLGTVFTAAGAVLLSLLILLLVIIVEPF